jgi:hypothetical protein
MRHAFIACLASVLAPATAWGGILVGNLGEPLAGSNFATASQWFATPFVTGENPVELAEVRFDIDPGQMPEPDDPIARVYEDDGNGLPGALLTELINPPGLAPTLPLGIYAFAAPPGVTLAANTRYYVSLVSDTVGVQDNRADWTYTSSSASYGPGTALGDTYQSFDQGASWHVVAGRNPLFEVRSPTTVPSLTTPGLALLALLIAAIAGVPLRRHTPSG